MYNSNWLYDKQGDGIMTNKELQLELDIKKWIESERAGMDLCGNYEYCKYCEKDLKNPCAEAYNLLLLDNSDEDEEELVDSTSEDTTEAIKEATSTTVVEENIKPKKKSKYVPLTFAQKLAKVKPETVEKYTALKALVEEYGFTTIMLKRYVIVRFHGVISAKITLNRNSLKMHMALNPAMYQKQTHLDYSHFKCYLSTPFTMKYDTKKSFKDTATLLPKLVKKAEKQLAKEN